MSQIIPIRDLKKTSEPSEMCRKVKEPVFITKNGYGYHEHRNLRKNDVNK